MKKVTFKVDEAKLFESLGAMNGDCSAIGSRLVGVMLTGEADLRDAVGMQLYGIELDSVEEEK